MSTELASLKNQLKMANKEIDSLRSQSLQIFQPLQLRSAMTLRYPRIFVDRIIFFLSGGKEEEGSSQHDQSPQSPCKNDNIKIRLNYHENSKTEETSRIKSYERVLEKDHSLEESVEIQ